MRLERDERVLGIPRLLFVVSAGCLGVVLVAFCAMSINYCQRRQQTRFNNYSFAALAQRSAERDKHMFEDDDEEEEETEVFRRTPIKSELMSQTLRRFRALHVIVRDTENAMQPYYDEEMDGPPSADEADAEHDDEDDIDVLNSEEEIVLIHRP